MEKRSNKYSLTISEISLAKESDAPHEPLTLKFDNHDNILGLVEKFTERNVFDKDQSTEFIIGLKLFSEVMIKNRNNPLFEEFAPAFGAFMKKLKGK